MRRLAGPVGIALIALGFCALSLWLTDRCLDDDAYISFRYAQHLLDGHGLVYNPGERVEGYTNFLWTVLMAGAMAAGAPADVAAQMIGLLLGAASLLLMYRMARRAGLCAGWSLAAPAALAATLPFAVEGLLGLEMPLYVLLSLAALALWSEREQSPPLAVGTGVVFALCAMTRPEGMALFALSFLPELREPGLRAWRAWPWRRWLWRAAGFAALFAPFFAWRFWYYGYPLPNTFYAKTGGGGWIWALGAEYIGSALLRSGPLVLVVIASLAWPRARREWPAYARLAAPWTGFMAVYLISVGGDFRPHYRFFVPLLPWLLLAAVAAARALPLPRAPVAAALALLLAWPAVGFHGPAMTWVRYREVRNPQLFAVGRFMRSYAPPGSLMAISGGGIVPWESGLPAIEMWGLTDVHLARVAPRRIARGVPGHLKGDGAYILSRRPRYILFIAIMYTRRAPTPEEVAVRIASPSELDLWQSEAFHRDYRLRSFRLEEGGVVNFFELREGPLR